MKNEKQCATTNYYATYLQSMKKIAYWRFALFLVTRIKKKQQTWKSISPIIQPSFHGN